MDTIYIKREDDEKMTSPFGKSLSGRSYREGKDKDSLT